MNNNKCNFCGSEDCKTKTIEYLYSHKGQYLLVPNTPVEMCNNCGMMYYEEKVLKNIEQHFFNIQKNLEAPDRVISIPEKRFAA